MRVRYAETTPTPAHAVKVGDHVRERRTGEVRRVEAVVSTLTERRFVLDDGTAFDAMFLDSVHVTHAPVSAAEVRSHPTNNERLAQGQRVPAHAFRAADNGLPVVLNAAGGVHDSDGPDSRGKSPIVHDNSTEPGGCLHISAEAELCVAHAAQPTNRDLSPDG